MNDEPYESEDSDYGNWNPNIFVHNRTSSETLDRSAQLNN